MDYKPTDYAQHAHLGLSTLEIEVIDRLHQLTEALRSGEIGFEYYTTLSNAQLSRVGWGD